MKKQLKNILNVLFFGALLTACQDDGRSNLPSAAERADTATTELMDLLTAPDDGWVLNYRPNPDAGAYYILMDFDNNGTVRIQSDVPDDNGAYYDHTVAYRIDVRLNLQLILETYGVFHFLFEQNFFTFGAEFEFIYQGEENGNLVFTSKSDSQSNATVLTFTPASSGASNAFSREIAENLQKFEPVSPQFLGARPSQHISVPGQDISIFWNIDFLSRNLTVTGAGEGTTIDDVIAVDKVRQLDHSTGYSLINGKLVLDEEFSFSAGGRFYTFNEISLSTFNETGNPMCAAGSDPTASYDGSITGIGAATVNKTLFDGEGMDFQPMSRRPYAINVFFIFTPEGFSLTQNGSIGEFFPGATGFAFNYGFDDDDEPAYAVGLYTTDDNGNNQVYLREFEPTTTYGNMVDVNFNDNFYFSETPGPDVENNLRTITDEIFENGEVYASIAPHDEFTVFRLYNPCNGYEIYLVQ